MKYIIRKNKIMRHTSQVFFHYILNKIPFCFIFTFKPNKIYFAFIFQLPIQ